MWKIKFNKNNPAFENSENKWISIEERLPKIGEYVEITSCLNKNEIKIPYTAKLMNKGHSYAFEPFHLSLSDITYWRKKIKKVFDNIEINKKLKLNDLISIFIESDDYKGYISGYFKGFEYLQEKEVIFISVNKQHIYVNKSTYLINEIKKIIRIDPEEQTFEEIYNENN